MNQQVPYEPHSIRYWTQIGARSHVFKPFRRLHTHVYCSIVCSGEEVEVKQTCIDKCMGKYNMAYTHNGVLFSLKKGPVMCYNVDEVRYGTT